MFAAELFRGSRFGALFPFDQTETDGRVPEPGEQAGRLDPSECLPQEGRPFGQGVGRGGDVLLFCETQFFGQIAFVNGKIGVAPIAGNKGEPRTDPAGEKKKERQNENHIDDAPRRRLGQTERAGRFGRIAFTALNRWEGGMRHKDLSAGPARQTRCLA